MRTFHLERPKNSNVVIHKALRPMNITELVHEATAIAVLNNQIIMNDNNNEEYYVKAEQVPELYNIIDHNVSIKTHKYKIYTMLNGDLSIKLLG